MLRILVVLLCNSYLLVYVITKIRRSTTVIRLVLLMLLEFFIIKFTEPLFTRLIVVLLILPLLNHLTQCNKLRIINFNQVAISLIRSYSPLKWMITLCTVVISAVPRVPITTCRPVI
jgi:hypothetical protein